MTHIDLIFGPIGAGKSFVAKELVRAQNSVVLATDDWFQHLFFADIKLPITLSWSQERIKRCEVVIWKVAMQILQAQTAVILDIGLATRTDRSTYLNLCEDAALPYRFHYVTAPKALRQQRVRDRNARATRGNGYVVSDELFAYADALFEVPTEEELQRLQATLHINDAT